MYYGLLYNTIHKYKNNSDLSKKNDLILYKQPGSNTLHYKIHLWHKVETQPRTFRYSLHNYTGLKVTYFTQNTKLGKSEQKVQVIA